jgi:cyclopropane-fatty-acyl-phospholipid synthase
MESEPVAVATRDANEQHYEPPAEFFATVLGPNLKYSSRLWTNGAHDLAQAEDRMLELSCKRAGIEDGMGVLDLGSGSGSLSLWIARRYPGCRTLAVSNSRSRAAFIRERCAREGFDGFEVVTADLNHFSTERRFNRVVPDHAQLDPSRIATFDLLISRQEGSFRIDIETIRTLASVVES